jgi:hypothetical protein
MYVPVNTALLSLIYDVQCKCNVHVNVYLHVHTCTIDLHSLICFSIQCFFDSLSDFNTLGGSYLSAPDNLRSIKGGGGGMTTTNLKTHNIYNNRKIQKYMYMYMYTYIYYYIVCIMYEFTCSWTCRLSDSAYLFGLVHIVYHIELAKIIEKTF